MKVLLTGATGFVGRHVAARLVERGHEVTAIVRDAAKAEAMPWSAEARLIVADIYSDRRDWSGHDALIHLAWPGLPNYEQLYHFEETLPRDYSFLKTAASGIEQLLVAGTCFEYGLREGCLSADMQTRPSNPYALAKDTLHKFLQALLGHQPFKLQWARLFYMYGVGQNPRSLLAHLERAAAVGDASFRMSGGEQLRDYLPVEEVARQLVSLAERPDLVGAFNICSGRPTSVRALAERRLRELGSNMTLELGALPYSTLEPMAFWGDRGRLEAVLGDHDDCT